MSKNSTTRTVFISTLVTVALIAAPAFAAPEKGKKPASGNQKAEARAGMKSEGASKQAAKPADPGQAPAKKPDAPKAGGLQTDLGKEPTFIKSDSLTLKSDQRTFLYSGNVEVKQGDLTLTSETLEGKYDENNKIQQLTARKKVVIVKGENIRATGEKAFYDAKTETVTLTENPELDQKGSVLTADLIRIFLKEDRSVAEGDVRVKLVKKNEEKDTSIKLNR